MINLVILSPIPALRAGLHALIAADPDFSVLAVASGLSEQILLTEDTQVVVMTREVLGEASSHILFSRPALPILVITEDELNPRDLSVHGVASDRRPWGVISADAPAEALQAAVRALAEGLVVASPELLQNLLASAVLDTQTPGDLEDDPGIYEHLTERENDVLGELARGLTNKQIALTLGISEHTVKFHISSVYAKLGASNRTEAVRKGARRGLIPL